MDEVDRQLAEIGPFGNVLVDELVHVLDGIFLPGGIAVSEVRSLFNFRAISLWAQNSIPLSMVIVGRSSCMSTAASPPRRALPPEFPCSRRPLPPVQV